MLSAIEACILNDVDVRDAERREATRGDVEHDDISPLAARN